jgi:hypothetical protein
MHPEVTSVQPILDSRAWDSFEIGSVGGQEKTENGAIHVSQVPESRWPRPLPLHSSGVERLRPRANGLRSAAIEVRRIDLAGETAWFGEMLNFGDILNMDGPLVEIGPR